MAQNESVKKEETENKDEKMTSAADVDLSSMLDKLDDMELPDDTLPEETITDMLPETEPVPAVEETGKTEAEEQPESQESILEDVYKNAVEKETEKNSTEERSCRRDSDCYSRHVNYRRYCIRRFPGTDWCSKW